MKGLDHKVAMVTGASRGIGKAIAIRLLREGTKVVLTCRDIDRCLEMIQAEDKKADAAAIEVDVRDRLEVQHAVQLAVDRFEGIDVLVNNAGVGPVLSFLELTEGCA